MNKFKNNKPIEVIPKFLGLEYLKYRLGAKKATIKLKVGTLKVKWLQELK